MHGVVRSATAKPRQASRIKMLCATWPSMLCSSINTEWAIRGGLKGQGTKLGGHGKLLTTEGGVLAAEKNEGTAPKCKLSKMYKLCKDFL